MMKKTRGRIIYTLIGVSVLGLIVWSVTRPRPGESLLNQGNQHLSDMTQSHKAYNSSPPTSGPHLNQKALWGVSDEQIIDELQIHNLEDGGVVLHYNPEVTDEATIALLSKIVNKYPDKVLLEPYAGLETPIVLTAWTKIDKLAIFDEERIISFIDFYRGKDHHT